MPPPRIFVSHSHHDNAFGLQLIGDLRARLGEDAVWYDASGGLHGGDEWWRMIVREITERDTFLVILSPQALASDWVPREMGIAYYQHVKLGKKLLPVIYQPCAMTADWEQIQGYDFGDPARYAAQLAALLRDLGVTPQQTPPSAPASLRAKGFAAQSVNGIAVIIPPTVAVPAGPFLMGSDKRQDRWAEDRELPQHSVTLGDYHIGTYPLTVAEYASFVSATQRSAPPGNPTWEQQQADRADHPVVNVSCEDVVAYADWLAQVTGQPWRLPTEAEWEKAARGTDGRIYPWGNAWEEARANTYDDGPAMTTPVGGYPGGVSPVGAHDLAGNVWEWCSTIYRSYPYKSGDGREDMCDKIDHRVLRGGAWYSSPQDARVAIRSFYRFDDCYGDVGARLAVGGARAGSSS